LIATSTNQEERPMKPVITIPEAQELIKKISNPESFLDSMRFDAH